MWKDEGSGEPRSLRAEKRLTSAPRPTATEDRGRPGLTCTATTVRLPLDASQSKRPPSPRLWAA